jgi:hypothetical integral membrane protein (TIGR02206 family)
MPYGLLEPGLMVPAATRCVAGRPWRSLWPTGRMPSPPFPLFGPAHLVLLAAVPATGLGLAAVIRARRGLERPIRLGLSALLAVNQIAYLVYAGARGWIAPPGGLPLEICDLAAWLAVAALAGAPPVFGELLYFVGLAGTVQALLTPDLGVAFPSYPAAKFFLGHGGTVAAAILLLATGRLRPRPGAWWRALLWLNAYAAAVLVLDLAAGTNYIYLARKPPVPTLLDAMGPWPWYILTGDAAAAALFFLLQLPFRSRRSGQGDRPPS